MRVCFLCLMLLACPVLVNSQETGSAGEQEAVRRVVETYLYAEETEERKRTMFDHARVLSVAPDGRKVTETPVSKSSPRRKGEKVRSRQKIVSIDLAGGAAVVKVETDLSFGTANTPKHLHYLSLLKVNGEWKIVSVLMPPAGRPSEE